MPLANTVGTLGIDRRTFVFKALVESALASDFAISLLVSVKLVSRVTFTYREIFSTNAISRRWILRFSHHLPKRVV